MLVYFKEKKFRKRSKVGSGEDNSFLIRGIRMFERVKVIVGIYDLRMEMISGGIFRDLMDKRKF